MDQSRLPQLPTKPGVYIFRDKKNKAIYVGKAKNLKRRVSSYFSKTRQDAKTIRLIAQIKTIEHIIVNSEVEAFLLESNLIKKYKPKYNVVFVDDKSYPYLEINKKNIPYVVLTHKKENLPAGRHGPDSVYFGPYVKSTDLKIVLRILRKIFPFQSVKNHANRRCMFNHIGLCPCVQVFPDRLPEYKKNIRSLVSFLKGNKNKVVRDLRKEQVKFINREGFEEAAEIQRKIEKIEYITSRNYDPFRYEERTDFYLERIRTEVSSLADILNKYGVGIKKLVRIECYDISNISGKNAAGSMVVFTNGDSNKSEYRRFKVRLKNTPDDFEMMREVLQRRIRRTDWNRPDLMVIDGGRGQVSTILRILAEQKYNVPVIGLAKKEESIILPVQAPRLRSGQASTVVEFLEIRLPHSTPGLNLLRRIRNEAHRFALHYHKLLRKKFLNLK